MRLATRKATEQSAYNWYYVKLTQPTGPCLAALLARFRIIDDDRLSELRSSKRQQHGPDNVVLLDIGAAAAPTSEIPTLSGWSMMMIGALAWLGVARIRRERGPR